MYYYVKHTICSIYIHVLEFLTKNNGYWFFFQTRDSRFSLVKWMYIFKRKKYKYLHDLKKIKNKILSFVICTNVDRY